MSPFETTLRELLAAGHDARFRASGDSMYPTIRSGDYLHVVSCDASELRPGEVVLMSMDRGLTAHRIVRISGRGGSLRIVTRADNAVRSDGPNDAANVLGRVVGIERDQKMCTPTAKSATIIRFAAVLVRRLRSGLQQKPAV